VWPDALEGQARAIQWSFWVMTEVEANLLEYLTQTVVLPEAQRNPDAALQAKENLAGSWAVLDRTLASSPYLLGSEFSVADLNVAAVLSWARIARVDFSAMANLERWLGKCLARPAAISARG
jgi:glutathione S-transferase